MERSTSYFYPFFLLFVFFSLWSTANGASKGSDKVKEEIRELFFKNPADAVVMADSLLEVAISREDDQLIAECYYLLGVGNYYLTRVNLSSEYYKKALQSDYAKGDPVFAEKCWNNLGVNYDVMERIPEAFEAYMKSLVICEELNDQVGVGQCWINISLLDIKTANYERAESRLRKALEYFTRANDTLNKALCYQNFGKLYISKKEPDKALQYQLTALSLYRELNYYYGVAQMLMNISMNYIQRDDDEQARPYLDEALRVSEEIGASTLIADIYMEEAGMCKRKQKYDQAIDYMLKAKSLFIENGNNQAMEDLYLGIAGLYVITGNRKGYDQTMEEYFKVAAELKEKRALDRYEELRAIYETESKEKIIIKQAAEIRNKRTLLIASLLIIIILAFSTVVIVLMMIRMRRYIESLYQNNLALQHTNVFPVLQEEPVADNTEGSKLAELYNRIIHLMENEKLFCRNDLSVSDLSSALNTNDKYVSQAINTYSNNNFNAFVNAYRINEARRLITEHGKNISIKELADRVGFSSLNTFYKNFKEITGLTPSLYMDMSEKNAASER